MACYTEFGWTPDTIKNLPESESLLLAVYFEELSRVRAKQAEEANSARGAGDGWHTDLSVGEDDEEDASE